jgi:O-antigen ligase
VGKGVAAAIDDVSGRSRGGARPVRWALHHLLSFESLFVLFLYSNEIKVLLPTMPVDETVLFGVMSMAVGAWIIARQGIPVRGLAVVVMASLFVAWALASYGWTPSRILIKRQLAYLVVFNMWCVIGGALVIAGSRERTVRFLCLTLLVALFVALSGLRLYLMYGDFRRLPIWSELGFSRTYLNWGYTVADGAGVALVITLFSRFLSLKQLVAAGMLLACAGFVLVGGARGPMVGVALAAMVALSVRPPRVGPGRIEVSVGQIVGLFLVVAAAAYVSWLIATGQTTTTLSRFIQLFESAESDEIVVGASRWLYWPAAIRFWLDAPWLGNGFASFSYLYHEGGEYPGGHPHNVVLQILAELGVVGLILFGAFVWSALRHASLRRLREDPLMVCVLIYLATGMMNSMFAKELTGGRKLFFAVGLLALRPATQALASRAHGRLGEPRSRRSAEPGTRPAAWP